MVDIEKAENKRQMYWQSGVGRLTTIHLSLFLRFFFPNVYHSMCVWPTALKLGCITDFDMLFLVMGFISLVDEIQFILISSHHICIRSVLLFINY